MVNSYQLSITLSAMDLDLLSITPAHYIKIVGWFCGYTKYLLLIQFTIHVHRTAYIYNNNDNNKYHE